MLTLCRTSYQAFEYEQQQEIWTNYYDILVHHAFGNYRDVLKEVSASPLMAHYLTFLGNRAFDTSGGKYPDENYAREVMQLFTIGLWELNMDGTQKKDPKTGLAIGTYTNVDITSFAKVWTGFNRQAMRGNIFTGVYNGPEAPNTIDPMKLDGLHRDRFPKTKLKGGHLGDHYSLCTNLPKRHFLRKGAKFRYHGTTSMLGEVHDNPGNNSSIRSHVVPDSKSSNLYKALCAADVKTGKCTYPTVVELTKTTQCHGDQECEADNLRAIKIVDGAGVHGYYTYIEPPCVRLLFFNEGRMARAEWQQSCVDPELAETIGTACCTKPANTTCPSKHSVTFETLVDTGYDYVYVSRHNRPTLGDVCIHSPTGTWECPQGCKKPMWRKKYWEAPQCVTDASTSDIDLQRCDLNLRRVISDNGGECKYIAEPMKYKTAEKRCAKAYPGGGVCDSSDFYVKSLEDASSSDWNTSCAGFQADWTTGTCRLQVQVGFHTSTSRGTLYRAQARAHAHMHTCTHTPCVIPHLVYSPWMRKIGDCIVICAHSDHMK